MFGCDLVGARGQISAAIADLSPTSPDLTLPEVYRSALAATSTPQFSQPRDLPPWGDIFSEFCIFIRPTNPEEETLFLSRVDEFLRIHCTYGANASPVSMEQQAEILASQHYYCTQQQKNDKTRRVLEKAFGPDWAEYYMKSVLFDVPTT